MVYASLNHSLPHCSQFNNKARIWSSVNSIAWELHVPKTENYVQRISWRMVSSGLLGRMALVRTDVSEEPGASFIRVTSNRRTLRRNFFAAYVGC
jgi:hypothetical protein